jgi:hypothetical protein
MTISSLVWPSCFETQPICCSGARGDSRNFARAPANAVDLDHGRGAAASDAVRNSFENHRGPAYCITWSACSRSDWGIVRPNDLAALRLITSSKVLGCSTGNSAGLAPFSNLST